MTSAPELMSDASAADRFSLEAARIREVYARRKNDSADSPSEPWHRLVVEEREQRLRALLGRHGRSSLDTARILEIGCGTGFWLRRFVEWGARPEHVWGVDLLAERIATARRLCPPAVTLECRNATRLDAEDAAFDLVVQATVFTSILDMEMKRQIAREMLRVLRPHGLILWYDFFWNNPHNPNVRGVRRAEIQQLFPSCRLQLETLTLAPPIGRRVARRSPFLHRVLSSVKPLCTHYLGTIAKL
jgi:SAM-dependent methyltransferase